LQTPFQFFRMGGVKSQQLRQKLADRGIEEMKKRWQQVRRLILVGLVALFVGNVGMATTVQAATWHKGTPKALRGLYQSTAPRQNSASGFPPVIELDGKTFSLGESNNPIQLVKKVKYHKAHGVYYFKGHMEHQGWVKARNVRFALKKTGKQIHFVSGKHFFYQYSGEKFKRTTHVTGYRN